MHRSSYQHPLGILIFSKRKSAERPSLQPRINTQRAPPFLSPLSAILHHLPWAENRQRYSRFLSVASNVTRYGEILSRVNQAGLNVGHLDLIFLDIVVLTRPNLARVRWVFERRDSQSSTLLRRRRESKRVRANLPGPLYQRCARDVASFQFVH